MERIAEPELMDGEAQAEAYAAADFEEPHNRFVALLREAFPDLGLSGMALDLGCGPADVTIRFARAFPGWSVDGLDGSTAMLRLGRISVRAAGLSARVELHHAYLPDDGAPRPSYDLVFSNSLLHHLRDPRVLWRSIDSWARPGAAIFVMDLLRPESREEASRLVDLYAAGEPEVLRRDFYHSLLAAYREEEVASQLAETGLRHLHVARASDRHLVVQGRR